MLISSTSAGDGECECKSLVQKAATNAAIVTLMEGDDIHSVARGDSTETSLAEKLVIVNIPAFSKGGKC